MIATLVAAAALSTTAPSALPDRYVAFLKGVMEKDLPDYDSTKVKQAFIYEASDEPGVLQPVMCVWANTKNRFGGYDGYRWIWVIRYTKNGNYDLMLDGNAQAECASHTDVSIDGHDYGPELAPRP